MLSYQISVVSIVLIAVIVGSFYIITTRDKNFYLFKKAFSFLIFAGLLLPGIAVISIGFIENRWDVDFISKFLLFEKVESKWFFVLNDFCMWGYIIFCWGITMRIVTSKKSKS